MTEESLIERIDRSGMRLLKSAGLYPRVRQIFRRISPKVRRTVAHDSSLYSQFIADGDLVFDIGANFGIKSRAFLKCGARVVALEPNPLCEPTLRLEVSSSKSRFTLVQKAISDSIGTALLNVTGTDPTASLRPDWPWLNMDSPDQLEVETTTLDALISAYGRPAFCKVDVEGYELNCFNGLSELIPVISFEYHLDETEQALACLARLGTLGHFEANVIAMESEHLQFARWSPAGEFGRLIEQGAVPIRGDIFVRSTLAESSVR